MKLFSRKPHFYLVSWYAKHVDTGENIFGNSEIFLTDKWDLGMARTIAADIENSIGEEFGRVTIIGVNYIGRRKPPEEK